MNELEQAKARLDALFWLNMQPDYWVITTGPGHPTEPVDFYGIRAYENTGREDPPVGDLEFQFTGPTMEEVLDQLVAWRVEGRLS